MAKKASKKKVEKESINESHENQVEDLKLEDQLKEEKDKFLRLFAEFENYKRRTAKERIELFSTASEEVMISLLPILDDFDRASVEIEKDLENETLKGVLLIKNKLFDSLKSKGLSLVDVKKGDEFNADDHEAVTQIPAPSKDMVGKIIDIIEVKKGRRYLLGSTYVKIIYEVEVEDDTEAILATHCFGNPCDIDAIDKIAQKYNLKVIYDAAHCFGTIYKGKSIFNYGDISAVSFHATKLYHTIEGGAVVTQNPDLLKRMSFMRNFGHNGPEKFNGIGIILNPNDKHYLIKNKLLFIVIDESGQLRLAIDTQAKAVILPMP